MDAFESLHGRIYGSVNLPLDTQIIIFLLNYQCLQP